jgi:hypothetical protein
VPAELLAETLAAARTIEEAKEDRARALAALLPYLRDAERINVLQEVIESCERLPRPQAIATVAQLAPVLAEVGGDGIGGEIAWAICDVGSWWP